MSVYPDPQAQPPPYPAPGSQAPMPTGPPMGQQMHPNMVNQQQMSTNITIVNQQPVAGDGNKLMLGSIHGHRDWTTSLFGCFEDCGSTLYTLCCPTCVLWSIALRLGENCCVADCIPGGTILLRTRLRTLGGIRGSICGDYCAVVCCPYCVVCQMDRELKAMSL